MYVINDTVINAIDVMRILVRMPLQMPKLHILNYSVKAS